MSRYDQLNLLDVPVPDVLSVPPYESLLATRMSDLASRFAASGVSYDVGDLETDPLKIDQEVSAFREAVVQARINDAVRAVMLASSRKADLDNFVADFGLARKLLVPADPTANPPTAAVYESDDSLRQRRLLAPEALSTAGPGGAYAFHELDALAGVLVDAVAYGPEDEIIDHGYPLTGAGIVAAVVLPAIGAVVPASAQAAAAAMAARCGVDLSALGATADAQAIAAAVADHLNAWSIVVAGAPQVVWDKGAQRAQDKRPLSDEVRVRVADVGTYQVTMSLDIPPGPDPEIVLAQARARVLALTAALYQIGAPVPVDLLKGAATIFDAKNAPLVLGIDVASPATTLAADPLNAWRCTAVTITQAPPDGL